jgi:hypothetical protein
MKKIKISIAILAVIFAIGTSSFTKKLFGAGDYYTYSNTLGWVKWGSLGMPDANHCHGVGNFCIGVELPNGQIELIVGNGPYN